MPYHSIHFNVKFIKIGQIFRMLSGFEDFKIDFLGAADLNI